MTGSFIACLKVFASLSSLCAECSLPVIPLDRPFLCVESQILFLSIKRRAQGPAPVTPPALFFPILVSFYGFPDPEALSTHLTCTRLPL